MAVDSIFFANSVILT